MGFMLGKEVLAQGVRKLGRLRKTSIYMDSLAKTARAQENKGDMNTRGRSERPGGVRRATARMCNQRKGIQGIEHGVPMWGQWTAPHGMMKL